MAKKSTKKEKVYSGIEISKTKFRYNTPNTPGSGLFFQNHKTKKYKKKESDFECQSYDPKFHHGLIDGEKGHHFCFQVSIEELEKIVKEAKKTKKSFNKKGQNQIFFKHLNPELSFLFSDQPLIPKKPKDEQDKEDFWELIDTGEF